MFKIYAKNPNFRGQLAGLIFHNGTAETDNEQLLDVLKKLGCRIKDMDKVSEHKYTIYSQNDGYKGIVGGLMFIDGEAYTDNKTVADYFKTMRQFKVEENKVKQASKKTTKKSDDKGRDE